MRKFFAIEGMIALLVGASVSFAQEMPEMPEPTPEHEWLQQLSGEWTGDITIYMPEQEPMKSKGTEQVRSVGKFWTVSEHTGDFGGQTFTGIQTLGYDSDKGKFVGNWIDSMSGYMWIYEGSLDESRKVLTLMTEGPCPMRPGKKSPFKEVIELKSDDRKVFTSYVQDESGEWIKGLEIDYRRKSSADGTSQAR